jgi:hypothetical protein
MAERFKKIAIPDGVASLVNLHAKNPSFSMNRFSENFAYGHQEILLKYIGQDFSSQIVGVIEHGASRPNFLEDVRSPRFLWGKKTNFWAWSKDTEELAFLKGFKNVKAIGAPWLYMKEAAWKKNELHKFSSNRFLVMPSHSTGNASEIANVKEKEMRARKFREIIGNKFATVCLHAADFCDPETREAFEKYEFKVTCVGSSLIQPVWSSSSNRVRSLYTLMKLMKEHTHFITDHYGTALIYAVDLGMEVSIFPEIKNFQKLDVNSSGKVVEFESVTRSEMEFMDEYFRAAMNNFAPANLYSEVAGRILGKDILMTPEELNETLTIKKNVYRYHLDVQPW